MTDLHEYIIESLFKRNQISAKTLIKALNEALECKQDVLESVLSILVNADSTKAIEAPTNRPCLLRITGLKGTSKLQALKTLKDILNLDLGSAKGTIDGLPNYPITYDRVRSNGGVKIIKDLTPIELSNIVIELKRVGLEFEMIGVSLIKLSKL